MDWSYDCAKLSSAKGDIEISCSDNHIYFYGVVNKKNMLELNKKIRDLNITLSNMKNSHTLDEISIYLHINSYGGDIFAVISTIDIIQQSKIPVITIIEGCAASAATLLSISGHKRLISKNSYMLIHELRSNFWGKMSEIEDEFNNLQNLTTLIKKLYKKHTTISLTGKEGLSSILKKDLWWDSNKCLRLGLVDEIIE